MRKSALPSGVGPQNQDTAVRANQLQKARCFGRDRISVIRTDRPKMRTPNLVFCVVDANVIRAGEVALFVPDF